MGKNWDKAVPSVEIWRECWRVLKPGSFLFCMSIPRQDCQAKMINNLMEAGFWINFSPIYWAYASGFPKAQNLSKAIDKKLKAERKIIGEKIYGDGKTRPALYSCNGSNEGWKRPSHLKYTGNRNIDIPETEIAKMLDGAYSGAQFKPAVEVVLIAMKPFDEKTFIDQALAYYNERKKLEEQGIVKENLSEYNQIGLGGLWLDKGRIPTLKDIERNYKKEQSNGMNCGDTTFGVNKIKNTEFLDQGRFPANLLVQDDCLNDGINYRGCNCIHLENKISGFKNKPNQKLFNPPEDSGSFSRYFDLDFWFGEKLKELPEAVQKTFPLLIVPKASKKEKNRGCESLENRITLVGHAKGSYTNHYFCIECGKRIDSNCGCNKGFEIKLQPGKKIIDKNNHPCVKPLKLFSYLIILASQEFDIVYDPFLGSGTTAITARMLNRKWIGSELEKEYCEIAECRIRAVGDKQLRLET